MRVSLRFPVLLLVLGAAFIKPSAAADCRMGFDVGSSGIRVGINSNSPQARTSIDFLTDVWLDNRIDATVAATVQALRTLPQQIEAPAGCPAVAGGYSAWRLAMSQGKPSEVAATLREIHQQSGVPLFVIPQDVEGSYGYFAAQQSLGDRLRTPFILDIGGGSMQIASIDRGWGAALGQKAWRKLLCNKGKGDPNPVCTLNPVGADAIATARTLLAQDVATARKLLGKVPHVTAVSAPLVKTIYPVMRLLAEEKHLIGGVVDATGFDHEALAQTIRLLADKDDATLTTFLDNCPQRRGLPICTPTFLPSLVSDMLIVHAFMEGLDIKRVDLAEANLTNVPGLLADTRAQMWADNYPCYLERLEHQGDSAFKSDPATCR